MSPLKLGESPEEVALVGPFEAWINEEQTRLDLLRLSEQVRPWKHIHAEILVVSDVSDAARVALQLHADALEPSLTDLAYAVADQAEDRATLAAVELLRVLEGIAAAPALDLLLSPGPGRRVHEAASRLAASLLEAARARLAEGIARLGGAS